MPSLETLPLFALENRPSITAEHKTLFSRSALSDDRNDAMVAQYFEDFSANNISLVFFKIATQQGNGTIQRWAVLTNP